MDNFSRITPVIIVKNGAQTLPRTLASLSAFAHVILYDNGSTDGTPELAAHYANVTVVHGTFNGFGPTKNAAAACAPTDWVLSLDSDESVSPDMLAALAAWPLDDAQRVGQVLRDNYFCGRHVRGGGWGRDWLCRLYHKGQHRICDSIVHESLQLTAHSRVVRLKGSLRHEAVTDIAQLQNKAQYYSELYANTDTARLYPFTIILLKALFGFIRSYLLQGGVFYGVRGFMIAQGIALGTYLKYAKVYQRRRFQAHDKAAATRSKP